MGFRFIPCRAVGRGLALVTCLFGAACERTHVVPVTRLSSVAAPGENLAAIELDRVVVNIERGQLIGHYRDNNFQLCGPSMTPDPIHWASGKISVEDEEVMDVFYREMRGAHYNVIGDPDALFGNYDDAQRRPDFLVAGRIDSIALDICDEATWNGYRVGRQHGAAGVEVTWQVYSLLDEKVVLETRTSGSAELAQGVENGEITVLLRAFAAAVHNLGGDPRFHDTLKRKNISAAATKPAAPLDGWGAVATYPALPLPPTAPFATPIGANMSRIEAAVVTVLTGTGHGSGFFIAPNLVLTNHHVALNAGQLKVRLINGTEVMATTIRSDKKRDVALLQISGGEFTPLPIRRKPVALTEEVYAVGSPLLESLAGTVTRGIVSQMQRDEVGLEYIQADAAIQPGNSGGPLLDTQGNIVGISEGGISADGSSLGSINLFIPIEDALKHLNIVPQ